MVCFEYYCAIIIMNMFIYLFIPSSTAHSFAHFIFTVGLMLEVIGKPCECDFVVCSEMAANRLFSPLAGEAHC